MEELLQYVGEQSIRGDIARELAGILNDYQSGAISHQDKEQLVQSALMIYQQNGVAENEIMWRWVISAATLVASAV